MTTINELISKAKETTRYTLDTESQIIDGVARGAVMQIQFVHSKEYSTIVLVETFYLPDEDSRLFSKIKELYSTIFSKGNEIISWGPYSEEVKNFMDYGLMTPGNQIEPIDLQDEFQDWDDGQVIQKTHPSGERRETTTGYYVILGGDETRRLKPKTKWSLQDALLSLTNQFLDKTETISKWSCGLDFDLGTWRRWTFSRHEYDQAEEKRKRLSMVDYAVNDCLATTELFFITYPSGRNISRQGTSTATPTTTRTKGTTTRIVKLYDDDELSDISDEEIEISRLVSPPQQKPTTTRETIMDIEDQLSGISEDELIEILKPKLNEHKPMLQSYDTNEQQQTQSQQHEQTPEHRITSKQEKQRRKNEKLKWKRRNRPDFQLKIKRLIYHRYDFRKIRSQLRRDGVYTNHQLTINESKMEVIIGFRSIEEQEAARRKIPIDYFSMEEYYRRWGRPKK